MLMNDERLQACIIGGMLNLSSGDDHVTSGDVGSDEKTTAGHGQDAGLRQGSTVGGVKT